jgi:DMSO/TMAO reductase YedYZ molybdopterin-dependent catalytic subunit
MAPLQDILDNTKANVAIEWSMQGKYIKMNASINKSNMWYVDTSEIIKFESGEGLVGKVFGDKQPLLVQNVASAPKEFIRKEQALDEGLQSIVFYPYEDSVVELGFLKQVNSIPSLSAPESGGYVLEDHAKIKGSIPGIKEVQEEVQAMMTRIGYVPNKAVGPSKYDANNTDKWVPRDPRLNRLTGIHPFNCEAPLSVLREHKYLTPATLHYVRNHGVCPKLFWDSHTIEITGLVDRPISLTMAELMSLPKISTPVTLNCAGNRRKEQNLIQKGIGFHWGCAAASTVIWTGVPLRAVLEYVGIQDKAKWINFAGPVGEVPAGDTTYGASHARTVCMNPARPCMIAFMMNGELLHPDHGYPVRLLMPGYIGGRMIKWLSTISVTEEEGDVHSHYHWFDNRVFPKHIDSKEKATEEAIWKDPAFTINDRNINSAIWSPAHCAKIQVSDAMYTVRGYAYAGAGRPVHRVEVTVNNAQNWRPAKIERFEKPDEFGQCWCWVFWSVEIPVSVLAKCGEFAVRAWDDSQNCQPERPTWNLMGMMNNNWFRVKVHALGNGEIWFEHPTQVDNRHSVDKTAPLNPQNEELHLLENGNLASEGWMTRMLKDVQTVYAPGKPEDLDPLEGWEREKQHIIAPTKIEAPVAAQPVEPSCGAGIMRCFGQ